MAGDGGRSLGATAPSPSPAISRHLQPSPATTGRAGFVPPPPRLPPSGCKLAWQSGGPAPDAAARTRFSPPGLVRVRASTSEPRHLLRTFPPRQRCRAAACAGGLVRVRVRVRVRVWVRVRPGGEADPNPNPNQATSASGRSTALPRREGVTKVSGGTTVSGEGRSIDCCEGSGVSLRRPCARRTRTVGVGACKLG